MSKSKFLLVALVTMMLAVSCAPLIAPSTSTPPPILTEEPATPVIPVTGVAVVQSLEVQILENSPIVVNVIVRGQLPDAGCTTISGVNQTRDGNSIKVTLATTTDPVALCAQALTPFEQVVVLDISNLPPARYIVNVNGVEQSFELLTRDSMKFKQELVAALNARNYELLKVMMGDSFMIGYWLSEGTNNTPDSAIDQLRTNLLNSSSPITADYARNLVELLGADPVTIVGPDVVEASPLLVSGLGAEGKDQAILFNAKLPDGSLYWHGLLFAKDGFVKPAPVIPVDTNAYPTNVKFVMAQRDVRLRSGPGTQFNIIGFIAEGQTAKVTGVSADGNWWRVICPDNSIGSCWVSAARNLTRPTDPPPDTSAYPTDVKYVLAQQNVSIYSGPGTQFSIIGSIAAGQTAQVTGINVDGKWWRVICPDNSIGSCWVSADTNLTRPTGLDGNADVQIVEIQILESYPLQVNAVARGQLPDAGCTTISSVNQIREGNLFKVSLKTRTDPLAFCAQILTPFEYVIPLEVGSLLAGRYIVNVNGVEASFDLPESVYPTDVEYVMAQRDVAIYSGPGSQHGVIGSIASGQTAKVTGVSADGNWWRVICPDNSIGSCWASANSADTQPTHWQ
jgi:uncharacterized protein YraI